MEVMDYYSCVMRIGVGDADPSIMDAELQMSGEHSHVVRPARADLIFMHLPIWVLASLAFGSYRYAFSHASGQHDELGRPHACHGHRSV
jgi:hypothetical protein